MLASQCDTQQMRAPQSGEKIAPDLNWKQGKNKNRRKRSEKKCELSRFGVGRSGDRSGKGVEIRMEIHRKEGELKKKEGQEWDRGTRNWMILDNV